MGRGLGDITNNNLRRSGSLDLENRKSEDINVIFCNLMGAVKRQRQTILGDAWQKDKRLHLNL